VKSGKDKKTVKKWKLFIGLMILFLSGVLCGAVGAGLYAKHAFSEIMAGRQSTARHMIMKKLTRDLNLTTAQQVGIEKIIEGVQADLLVIRKKYQPEVETVISRGIGAMKGELQPEQQRKLDAVYEQAKRRWMSGRGLPPKLESNRDS